MRIPAIALAAILSISCATRTTFVCPELPEPSRPTVPTLPEGALSCISDDTADRLSVRERRLVEYAEDLEVIVSTHNDNCQQYRGRDGQR